MISEVERLKAGREHLAHNKSMEVKFSKFSSNSLYSFLTVIR